MSCLDTNPLPLPFSELYTALETRAVDAQENPYSISLSNKFDEVQKYLSNTKHTYNAFVVLVSKKFCDTLASTEQTILQDAAVKARDYQRIESRAASVKALAELRSRGLEIDDVTAVELARMRKASRQAVENVYSEYEIALVKKFQDQVRKIDNSQ